MKKVTLIFLFCLLIFNAKAQIDITASNEQNKPCNISFKPSTTIQIKNANNFINSTLKPAKDNQFILKKTETDQLGFQHNQYAFYYKGILVEGLGYNLQAKNGIINSAFGNYFDIKSIPTIPSISEKMALAIALNSIKAKKYDWEIFGSRNPYPTAEILIKPFYKNYKMPPIFKLVYKFEITAIEPFSSDFVYIDATSGDLIIKSSKLHYIDDVQATAQTRYSGNQTIWTNITDRPEFPGFTLLEKNVSGRQIFTNNNNHNWSFGGGSWSYFLDADNFWSAIEWHNTNQDDVALDIHWANEKCFDYFKTVFNRIGYNNNSVYPAQNNIYHWGVNNPNALYYRAHSSDPSGYLLFGDGNANYNPFGSLDVYAHEYAHGLFDFAAYGGIPEAGKRRMEQYKKA